jgi:hypothetical protein
LGEDLDDGGLTVGKSRERRQAQGERVAARRRPDRKPLGLREGELGRLHRGRTVQPVQGIALPLLGPRAGPGRLDDPLDEPGRHDLGDQERDLHVLGGRDDLPGKVGLPREKPSPPGAQKGVQAHPQGPGADRVDLGGG